MAATSADEEFILVDNKRAKSDVWLQFALKKRKSDGMIIQNVAVCKKCSQTIKYSGGTSNLTFHVRRHHPLALANNLKLEPISKTETHVSQPSSQPTLTHVFETTKNKQYPPNSHRALELTDKVARFIVKGLRPFSLVDAREFKELLTALDPRFKCPSRFTFADRVVPKMYIETKKKVLSELIQAEQVALTTDGWTSCATDSYLTITSSHINIRWEIINFVLQTRVLNESHTAVHIAEVLQEAATEWHIPTTEGYPPVTTDNAANVTKAVSLCESILHVPCLAHTLNLAVQKSLKVKRVSHVMAKVRRIVAFFHRSPMASSLLKEKALLLTLPAHDLIIDVMTRWNSAFDMLSRYLEMQAAVVTVLLGKELSKAKGDLPALTDNEAQLAEEVVNFLKPMKDMTTLLCSEGSPTVSVIMPLKHHLLEVALKHCDEDSPTVREMKEIMVTDIKPRYSGQAEMLYCASAVDPRFKNLPFLSDVERYDVYKNVTTKVADVLQKRAEVVAIKLEPEVTPPLPVLPEGQDPPETETESGDALDTTSTLTVREEPQQKHCSKTKPCPDKCQTEETKTLLEGILGEVFVVSSEPAKSPFELAKLDVDQYQSELPISVGNNPLLWWRVNEDKFPRLSLLAKRVLCIPATSVPSERAFSTAGDILSPMRASMKPENLDMLLFLKKNLQ